MSNPNIPADCRQMSSPTRGPRCQANSEIPAGISKIPGRVQTPIRERLLGTKERVQGEGALIGLRQQDRRELEDLRSAGFRRAGGFQRDDGQWARRREKIRQARNIAFRCQRLQARTTRVLRGAGIRFRRRFRP